MSDLIELRMRVLLQLLVLFQKFREMQPLEPEEERLRSAERARRRQMREDKKAKKAVAFLSPLVYGDNNIGIRVSILTNRFDVVC